MTERRYPKRGEWYLCLRDNDGPWQAGWDHSKEAGGCEAHEHEIVPAPVAIEAVFKCDTCGSVLKNGYCPTPSAHQGGGGQ